MQTDSLTFLRNNADFLRFSKGEYVCHEGQPGHDMYIVLQGAVGIYLTTVTGELTEVSRIGSGDFFGEMAIFDKMPRSASCIALEDTICVSVNRSNLRQFLDNCPDIVEQMLVNMSQRIRTMDELLSRTRAAASEQNGKAAFAIPAAFHGRHAYEPRQDPKLFQVYKEECPLCGGTISVTRTRRDRMTVERVEPGRRVRYAGCEPLWYEVITCPHCLYSNHHLRFFNVNAANRAQIQEILSEQFPAVSKLRQYGTAFDRTAISYLQAIHLSERLNPSDHTLPGMLWLRLYWLTADAGDQEFAVHCAYNAAGCLAKAIDRAQIPDAVSRCSVALSTAHLMVYLGAPDAAKKYCAIAANSPDAELKAQAQTLVDSLR